MKDTITPTIEDLHDAYTSIGSMTGLPMNQRCRMLTEVFKCNPDAWRVVGITKAALEVFAQHNFKRVSGMGIHRAHLRDRAELYEHMLTHPMRCSDSWWEYYTENDRTVFSTISENMGDLDESDIIWFDAPKGLFKLQGFSWRHTKEEAAFLKNIHMGV